MGLAGDPDAQIRREGDFDRKRGELLRYNGSGLHGDERVVGTENGQNHEILNHLRCVRPGGDFEPKATLFGKIDVNGEKAHPIFKYLREVLPVPHDEPVKFMTNPQYIVWSPVTRNDITWNFEKFLLAPDGKPFRRYSRFFPTSDIAGDIETLIGSGMKDVKK
ncbi:unnamed protein product [Darwinula stevensoni]|uniref:glutathione peroxidase n=1 Tax=Darwinula stevensoni TaxID=69355 RepID=A0A7R8XLB9_9CRUS|nr:unnamed protein product [Darwinula stevensoni]CAG0894054.1 unnamed protein product [Darwinula stevensoni]